MKTLELRDITEWLKNDEKDAERAATYNFNLHAIDQLRALESVLRKDVYEVEKLLTEYQIFAKKLESEDAPDQLTGDEIVRKILNIHNNQNYVLKYLRKVTDSLN